MTDDRLCVILRPMTLDDVDRVVELDRLSFPTPWPAHTYRHEINNNRTSTMLVVEAADIPKQNPPSSWLFGRLAARQNQSSTAASPIIAYSGFWKIADEAHISTIAVHPDWRGRKLGELLVWAMFHLAMRQDAQMMTLEVRVSNDVAQNLYRKYGFEISGRRKHYYRDNLEDAHVMTAAPLNNWFLGRLRKYERELARILRVEFRDLPLEESQQFLADRRPSAD